MEGQNRKMARIITTLVEWDDGDTHALECPRFPFMRAAYLRFCVHSVHFLAPMIHIISTRRNNVLCHR